jgi:P22_AR N-terminal domain/ORF6C domain
MLAEDMTSVVITPTLVNNQQYKQSYTVLCLPLEHIPGWLFGVSPSRVRPELRDKVKQYRRECYRVLWEAFQVEALVRDSQSISTTSALEQIRTTALAVAQLAEQQMEMEQHLTSRLDKAAEVFIGFEHRLGTIEKKLSPAMLVSDEQAETISSTVKALAELLAAKDSSKNHYQGIFSELYRRFGVSSYKNIRLDRYEQVLRFLEDWRQSVSKES